MVKAVAAGDVGEAHERVHQGELPRVVELEAGDALARRVIVGAASVRGWPRSIKESRMSCCTFR